MERSTINGENDCENNAWSATDPESKKWFTQYYILEIISSINEALKCMLIETR